MGRNEIKDNQEPIEKKGGTWENIMGRGPKTIEEGFMQDIVDHPEDDAVRLIYADWLDEQHPDNNDPKAAFIRAQIDRVSLRYDNNYREKAVDLDTRVYNLKRDHGCEWVGDMPEGMFIDQISFSHGFPNTVTLDFDRISDQEIIKKFLEKNMTIRELLITNINYPELNNFLADNAKSLEHIDEIIFPLIYGPPHEFTLLLQSPQLKNLKRLTFFDDIGDEGSLGLMRSAYLQGLVYVNFGTISNPNRDNMLARGLQEGCLPRLLAVGNLPSELPQTNAILQARKTRNQDKK